MRLSISSTTVLAVASLALVAVSAQTTVKPTATSSTQPATSTPNFILPPTAAAPPPSATTSGPSLPGSSTNPALAGHCPGPLIPNIRNLTIDTCMGPCCIKCPAIESFYEPNKIQNVLKAAYYTRNVSLAFAVFMALSYLVLPGKRSQPHISVLFLTVSLSLWYAAFDIMPGVSNACLAVWRSDLIDRYYGWLTAICWVLPMGFAIPVAVRNLAEYPGIGFSCLVSTDNLNTYLFYPTAVYIYPAMLCHVVTVGKMIQMAMLSSKVDAGMSQLSSTARIKFTTTMQAKRLLRGQWRPALMLATVMTSLTVFWLFYFVDAHRLAEIGPKTEWLQQWVLCVMTSGSKGMSSDETQTFCAVNAKPHLPSIPWFTAAEMLLAIIGIVVAMVFIAKVEFWSEWGFLFSNIFKRGKLGNGSRGRQTPGNGATSTSPTGNRQYLPGDEEIRKGTRIGYNDTMPPRPLVAVSDNDVKSTSSTRNLNGGTQWYDMEDLLDKEYEVAPGQMHHQQQQLQYAGLERNLSNGSMSRSGPGQMQSPPPGYQSPPSHAAHNIEDPYTGDILYISPTATTTQDATVVNAWTPSTHTLTTPTRAYLVANDNHDRYVEQPVVPTPVPRASMKLKRQQQGQDQVYLSSPPLSPTQLQQREYPYAQPTTSLSPMPQKIQNQATFSGSLPRQMVADSVPMTSGARGSPAMTFVQASSNNSKPSEGSGSPRKYNSNESAAQIMLASRESIGASAQISPTMMMDQRNRSPPPPSVPSKSPARNQSSQNSYYPEQQQRHGHMSPTYPIRDQLRQG
ncbi:hypothetical protein BGZ83_007767 [Gryganskiella cystojenkinii]|nr:hypothetical protein BGZ83_007767 [Gryganskiella cystojenkinii]